MARLVPLLAVLGLVSGCTTMPTSPRTPPPPPPMAPAQLAKVPAGDNQVGIEGTPLLHRMEVHAIREGEPADSVPIEWSTSSGTLTSFDAFTGPTGVAHARLTLGAGAGEATVTARIRGEATTPPITFRVTAIERRAAVIEPGSDQQSAEVGTQLANPLRVRVTRDGAPRAGVEVTWTALRGTVAEARTLTDQDGVAQTTWTMPTGSGNAFATATVPGVPAPVSFTATARHGDPAIFEFVFMGEAPVNFYEHPVRVAVLDQYRNPAVGAALDWEMAAGPGAIRWASPVVGADGLAHAGIDPTGDIAPITIRVSSPVSKLGGTVEVPVIAPTYWIHFQPLSQENGQFRSYMNNTSPAVDTIPLGATVRWRLYPDVAVASQVPAYFLELPSETQLNSFPLRNDPTTTLLVPGTFHYRERLTGRGGTLVVR